MSADYDPEALDAALGVQLELKRIWEACGRTVGGWKVGFTTGDPDDASGARSRMPENYRPFGFVLEERIVDSGTEIPRSVIQSCQLEPELCLVLGSPLRGVVSADAARRAVAGVAPAFEVNEGRYVAKANPLPVRLAAGLNNWGIVVGSGIERPDWDVTTTRVEVSRGGEPQTSVSLPPGWFDDPYVSLARLSARLDRFGLGLAAGDRVITGAFSHHKVAAGETWEASFDGIGRVAVTFTP